MPGGDLIETVELRLLGVTRLTGMAGELAITDGVIFKVILTTGQRAINGRAEIAKACFEFASGVVEIVLVSGFARVAVICKSIAVLSGFRALAKVVAYIGVVAAGDRAPLAHNVVQDIAMILVMAGEGEGRAGGCDGLEETRVGHIGVGKRLRAGAAVVAGGEAGDSPEIAALERLRQVGGRVPECAQLEATGATLDGTLGGIGVVFVNAAEEAILIEVRKQFGVQPPRGIGIPQESACARVGGIACVQASIRNG